MVVSFFSMDKENHIIKYQAEVKKDGNTFTFLDKSILNTTIQLFKGYDFIILKRNGYCTMDMHFDLNKVTKGTYKNEDGIEFEFQIKTLDLKIEKFRISILYRMLMGEEEVSLQRIQFSFF